MSQDSLPKANLPRGVFEELKIGNKEYPSQKRELPVFAERWIEHLVGYTSQEIGEYLTQLKDRQDYQGILTTVHQILAMLGKGAEQLGTPLSRILYTHEPTHALPCYPEHLGLPALLLNQRDHHSGNFFKSLKFELQTANTIEFVVSYIRMSGLQLLLGPLQEFLAKGGKARIITSTYMSITEPKALEKLLMLKQIDVRVQTDTQHSFHTKAYLFSRHSGLDTAIVGSSNISNEALTKGEEWNIRVPNAPHLRIFGECQNQFEKLWQSPKSTPLSKELIEHYNRYYKTHQSIKKQAPFSFSDGNQPYGAFVALRPGSSEAAVQPNEMQRVALQRLQHTRDNEGKQRAAVIAATGTGKTYLAAFDVRQVAPQRVLFVAHRGELLTNAKATFEHVFSGEPNGTFGFFTGETKEKDARFLFASIQAISRPETLDTFAPDAFDYIIIDEFHHAKADTYTRVIDYFKPKFLLGLTATPERMDGKDVLAICAHNIAFEIRLRQALEWGLLAPFHYFGIADETVDYDEIQTGANGLLVDESLVHVLSSTKRVEHIIRNIKLYGYHGERLCALGFCVNVNHARFMSEQFTKAGIPATHLSGADNNTTRQKAIRQLQDTDDPLSVVFTVNIFNEGVDIPELNMLLFLRPTESPTVFIQQLGRGLRKVQGKEYTTVLDFIGNYRNSFMVPLALAGETGQVFDRDNLSKQVRSEFQDLPDGCYVDLDPIAQRSILEKLTAIQINSADWLKRLYFLFKRDLGASPDITDFLYTEGAPSFDAYIRKYGSWYRTKQIYGELTSAEEKLEEDTYVLEVSERLEQLLPLKWPYEFVLLQDALEHQRESISLKDVATALRRQFGVQITNALHESLILRAMKELSTPHKKQSWSFGTKHHNTFHVRPEFLAIANVQDRKEFIQKRLQYGLTLFQRSHQPQQFLGSAERLTLYQNYTREDLQFLYNDTAAKGSWREGVKRLEKQYFLFINLNKSDDVKDELRYHDYFISPKTFHWQSQNQTSHASTTGQNFIHHKERQYQLHLFVRKYAKMYGQTMPFKYLGEVDYVSSQGDKPMSIVWQLHKAVPDALFTDFSLS